MKSRSAMRFKTAVLVTPALADGYRPGLAALKAADTARIACDTPRHLRGSVDVDEALSRSHPAARRWDYAIGIRRNPKHDGVIWIEVHPASSTREVKAVLSKLAWLREWANHAAPALRSLPATYVWIATGSVVLQPNTPHRRRLAAAGIQFAGKRYRITT